MSDLIRREAVIDALLLEFPQINVPLVQMALERVSAVDAVEVVRCRVCKWWNKPGCAILVVDDSDRPTENDFCSYGERREENAVD